MAHGNQGKLKNNKVLNDYPSKQNECEGCTKLLNGMLFMKWNKKQHDTGAISHSNFINFIYSCISKDICNSYGILKSVNMVVPIEIRYSEVKHVHNDRSLT